MAELISSADCYERLQKASLVYMFSKVWRVASHFQQWCRRLAVSRVHLACVVALLCGAPRNISALQVAVVEHVVPTANSFPEDITLGPDGAFWFTEYGANNIGRITGAGNVTEYAVPTAGGSPNGITSGPDGALWFTEYIGNKIGRITLGGAITEHALPTPVSYPARITTGPDGALWFTEFNAQKIGRMTTQGVLTEYNLPPGSYPEGITVGRDGALWFTESTGNKIGRITTGGTITEYLLPTANSSPEEITSGPDGALWFTEQSANKIGRISTSGQITEYPAAGGGPIGITAGLDGALWFTEYFGVKIGRITTGGSITEYPVPTAGYLKGIASGPRGAVWFAENSANRVGLAVYETAVLTVGPSEGSPGMSVNLNGTGFAPGESIGIADATGPFREVAADNSGAFTITVPIRPAPYGSNSFVATGQGSSRLAVAKVFVTPKVQATPNIVSAGSSVTIEGVGFNAGDSIDVYVDGFFLVGTGTSDSRGSMAGNNAVAFTIPSSLPTGPHTLVATGSNGVGGSAHIIVQ